MRYFVNVKTLEELKKEYKKLAMQYHPDRQGGDLKVMQEINVEYEVMFKRLKDSSQNEYEKNSDEVASEYIEIINKIINLDGVNIEICGTWIWLSGNTKEYKDIFKELGFKWAKKKLMWYLGERIGHKKGEWSMDKIRDTFGSERVKSGFTPQLQ